MRLKSQPLALIILVLFFGGIAFTTWMGWWQTEGRGSIGQLSEGEAAGSYDPAQIRASYTFGEIADLFAIPAETYAQAFRLPADRVESMQIKELEQTYGEIAFEGDVEIGTASVRLFTAWYLGLPFEMSEETWLPVEAVMLLEASGTLTPEQVTYLETHTVDLDNLADLENTSEETTVQETLLPEVTTTADSAPVLTATPEGTREEPENAVTGQTTFQDLLDMGLSQADIEQVIGAPMPVSSMLVRDFASQSGMPFSEVKTALQALIDAL